MTPTDVRTRLAVNGYVPIPCSGKVPVLPRWQKRTETSAGDIDIWARTYPNACNTGVLTPHTPTLDIDVLDESAVAAAVELVREKYGDRGKVMLRYGRRPKVAILFRTDAPFDKIRVMLAVPDGAPEQKIELLCRGQQVIVHGRHPDTGEMYCWDDGDPGKIAHDALPPITEIEAQMLVTLLADVMRNHGYQVVDDGKRKRNSKHKGNGADDGKRRANDGENGADDTRADWGYLHENIRTGRDYHESLLQLSCKLVAAGTDGGAVVNILRDLMEQSTAPHDARWQDRFDDIPRLVDGALDLLRQTEVKDPPPPTGEDPAEPAPAVTAADGAAVLALVREYLTKYVSYPSHHALTAHVLWIAHTHLLEAFDSTARIGFLSVFPESGKTRALEATEPLVCRPVSTVNASANYLFRKAGDDAGPPTVLFDEIDTIFGPKAKDHEDIRGFINAGHRKGATYGRCRAVGNNVITEESPCYAACAMAGLGWLPDTLLSRAVVIRMQRRLPSEKVTPFRTRISIPEGRKIGTQLAAWARAVFDDAAAARPEMPEGVEDRQADAWEPLLAVADLVGGEWPQIAREAAVDLVNINRNSPASLPLRMLQDLRTVFWKNLKAAAASRPKGLITETVLSELHHLDDAPWATVNKGEPLSPIQLANHIRDYGVAPIQLRPFSNTDAQRRGYPLGALALVWRRYLPPSLLDRQAVNAVTGVTREALDRYFDWTLVDDDGKPVTDVTALTGFGTPREGQTTEVRTATAPNGGAESALEAALDAPRIAALAGWWRKRIKQLREELSPALAEDQARKELREVMAEQIQESALDTEINRVVRAASKGRKTKQQEQAEKVAAPLRIVTDDPIAREVLDNYYNKRNR
jgi:hypothetical protein